MKKFSIIGLFALFCASCIADSEYSPRQSAAPQQPDSAPQAAIAPVAPANIDMTQVYTYTPTAQPVAVQQPAEEDFYRRNIVVKPPATIT